MHSNEKMGGNVTSRIWTRWTTQHITYTLHCSAFCLSFFQRMFLFSSVTGNMLGNVQLQSGCLSSVVHRPWNERNVWLKSSMRTYRCFQASDVGRLIKWTIKLIETLTVSVFHASLLFMPLGKCKCSGSHIDTCVRDSLGESGQLFA